MAKIVYPSFSKNRGFGYWARPANLIASRRKIFRADHSNEWRYQFEQGRPTVHPSRSVPFSRLLRQDRSTASFRFIVLGDTGEGDQSQYGLLPLIRFLKPDFMIINGDLAYPAGRHEDYKEGFFQPYRDLRIPIWAVPGNHEYYSPNQGREFYEIFCTQMWGQLWADHGLILRQQPGTYWELKEPGGKPNLAVIGLDSGKAGNLDGKGRLKSEDTLQHRWLRARLREAERDRLKVIVLFHIPALAKGDHVSKVHLSTLHQILAESPNVRLVLCSHEHNYQHYTPEIFSKYLREAHGALPRLQAHYMVNGGGGAFLGSPVFKGKYQPQEVLPTPEQWREHTALATRVTQLTSLSKTLIGQLAITATESILADADASRLLSFLFIEVKDDVIKVTPVFMEDIDQLFPAESDEVQVIDPKLVLDQQKVAACLRPAIILEDFKP